MKEVWKAIPGYEGLYEASSLGRIKSKERYSKEHNNNGTLCRSKIKERILKTCADADGYLGLQLYNAAGVPKDYRVNRLVALTFVPNPDNLPQVDHINGVVTDNRAENLEWVSCKENIQRIYQNHRNFMVGKTGKGCRCIEDGNCFISLKDAATYYGVNPVTFCGWMRDGKPCKSREFGILHFEYISQDSAEFAEVYNATKQKVISQKISLKEDRLCQKQNNKISQE